MPAATSQPVVEREAGPDRGLLPVVVDHALPITREELDVGAQRAKEAGRHPSELVRSPTAGTNVSTSHPREAVIAQAVQRVELAVAVVVRDVRIVVLVGAFL